MHDGISVSLFDDKSSLRSCGSINPPLGILANALFCNSRVCKLLHEASDNGMLSSLLFATKSSRKSVSSPMYSFIPVRALILRFKYCRALQLNKSSGRAINLLSFNWRYARSTFSRSNLPFGKQLSKFDPKSSFVKGLISQNFSPSSSEVDKLKIPSGTAVKDLDDKISFPDALAFL